MSLLPKCKILYFVSDRAKALINLAKEKNKVPSVADIFHFKYNINKLLCLALSSKLRSSRLAIKELESKNIEEKCIEVTKSQNEAYAAIQFHTDLYVESMSNISQIVHPYRQGNGIQTQQNAILEINTTLSNIEQVIEACQIKDTYQLFRKSKNQLEDVVAVIPLWHDLVTEELISFQLEEQTKEWFARFLLPITYWEQALRKTKYMPQRNFIKQQIDLCKAFKYKIAAQFSQQEYEELKGKALFLTAKFQRASSQVEGRNGFLSQINHNQKGFDKTRLEVMTVIHNFDTRRIDGKTPAQRLFGNKMTFEPLFEYIIKNIDELPRPRKRKIIH
ncbi:MAG: DUF6399 domain-containing protein [Saprospiraceae bacterium]